MIRPMIKGANPSLINVFVIQGKICWKPIIIPVGFHNLEAYDSHLLLQAIPEENINISCNPNNTEKYISFSFDLLRVIDRAQLFLVASLEKQSPNLGTSQYWPTASQTKKTVSCCYVKVFTFMSTCNPRNGSQRPNSHQRNTYTANYIRS